MFIKEIIIEGFKSYAQRTHVKNFDPQFNAITGLNGSGKSNILDSICFVLGISNLAQVRATNLQELVYKNGQAGITKASVSIVFDNTDKKQTPVGYENFDELTITRQVVVGGRNRYLINGSSANNNRVSDLFRTVQLNINNPHFLIMQGRITKVLNMKPQEILSMIEEAAGTSLYESKKHSALKTIEKKDNKLLDINKILQEELNPTLEKLKTERSSYLEYQKVQRQIEALTRLVVAHKFTAAKKLDKGAALEVSSLQEQINLIEEEKEKSKANVDHIKSEVEKLECSSKGEASSKLEELESQITDYNKREVKAKSDLDNVLDAVKQEEKEKKHTIKSIHDTEKLISSKSEELTLMRAEVAKTKELEAAERAELEKAETNFTNVQAGQVEGEDGQQLTYTDLLIKLKDELSEAQTANKQAQLKLKHFQNTIKKMETDSRKAEKEIGKDKAEFDAAVGAAQLVEKKIKELRFSEEKYEELQREKSRTEDAYGQCSNQVAELVRKFPQLQFEYSLLEPGFDRSRVKGLVADLFTLTDTQYAVALEVAAGSRLYNVVTDTEDTSSLLIKHGQLRRRHVMIPLNKIRSNVVDKATLENAKKLVGAQNCHLALDVITFDKEVESAMKYCFGGVLICKTKEQAKRVAFDNSVRRKVITLEGDVYDPAGTLTGGSRNISKCVLLELASCKAARSDLSKYKNQLEDIVSRLDRMKKTWNHWNELSGELRLKQHEQALLESRLKQSSHYKDIEALRNTKEDLGRQQEVVDTFASREAELLAKCGEVEAKMRNFKEVQETELKKAEKMIAECRVKLKKRTKESKIRENKLKELELELGGDLAGELENLRAQLPRCDAAIEAAELLVSGARNTLEECQKSKLQVSEELRAQQDIIRRCSDEIERLMKEQKAMEKMIATSAIKQKELNHKLTKVNKDASEAKNKVENYLNSYEWIGAEEQYFGQKDTAYDFEKHDMREEEKRLDKLSARKESLGKNVNMRAMHLLGEAEKRYLELVKRKTTVEHDKEKINKVISDLEEKKNKAVKKAWEQVNKDFASIFSTLLPGAKVMLQTLEGQPLTHGLQVKVGFGDVWKESLTELSGGQRSLVALSLILSLLLFKPAPLYILDEVDAALDLSHTQNIGQMLKTHFRHSQFIVVSLKDGMFQNANVLFRTKFVDGVSTVSRVTQHLGGDKENLPPQQKKNKKQRV